MRIATYHLIECPRGMRIVTYHLIECPRGMTVLTYHLIECLSIIRIVNYPLIECPRGMMIYVSPQAAIVPSTLRAAKAESVEEILI